jgi:hypothetical protein
MTAFTFSKPATINGFEFYASVRNWIEVKNALFFISGLPYQLISSQNTRLALADFLSFLQK